VLLARITLYKASNMKSIMFLKMILQFVITEILDFFRMLYTFMAALGLMEILLDNEVTASDGTSLGRTVDIESDLMQGEITAIVENQGSRRPIPVE
jgi:hypothetical protein